MFFGLARGVRGLVRGVVKDLGAAAGILRAEDWRAKALGEVWVLVKEGCWLVKVA